MNEAAVIADYLAPDLTVPQIAARHGISRGTVGSIAKRHGLRRAPGPTTDHGRADWIDETGLTGGRWVRHGLTWRYERT